MYVCMYVRTYVCMYVRTYVRMYVCITYIYICHYTKFGHRKISNKWHQEYLLTLTVIFLEAIFKHGLLVSVR